MSPLAIAFSILALLAGVVFPFQAAVNAQLGGGVGGPMAATLVSFFFGLVFIAAADLLVFRQFPSVADLMRQPPGLLLAGGAIGAVYVAANVFLAPRIGAGALLCLVVAGQLLGALVIDRFGLFGLAIRELSFGRIVGAGLVFAGALLVKLA